MPRTLTVVPRWAGHATSDFYPWLHQERPVGFDTLQALEMPEPQQPRPGAWVAALTAAMGTAPGPGSVLMGHSVGCQAVLRYLEALPPGARVEGVVLVAAWWGVDKPWESLLAWTDRALDLARIRAAARCWRGPVESPNQASLVMFTIQAGRSAPSTACAGKMVS